MNTNTQRDALDSLLVKKGKEALKESYFLENLPKGVKGSAKKIRLADYSGNSLVMSQVSLPDPRLSRTQVEAIKMKVAILEESEKAGPQRLPKGVKLFALRTRGRIVLLFPIAIRMGKKKNSVLQFRTLGKLAKYCPLVTDPLPH